MAKFWTYNNTELNIDGMYKNQSCFIVVGGPSLAKMDLTLLKQPGITTIGVNNSVKVFRPNMWISVDDPANFIISTWKDPLIQKFVMHGKKDKRLWDNTRWCESDLTVGQCPNVVYYRDNEHFKPTAEYLDEDTFNWGNHTDRCECGHMRVKDLNGKKLSVCSRCGGKTFGSRSVLLAAVKLAYTLGFKNVFIVGADFKMTSSDGYAWDQKRSESSIKTNNETYERLNLRFSQLRPVFEKRGFYVFNATLDSNLNSFVKISLHDAVDIALKDFPNTKTERTYGMYERKAVDKKIEEETIKIAQLKEQSLRCIDKKEIKRLCQKIDRSQEKLRSALEEKETIESWTA